MAKIFDLVSIGEAMVEFSELPPVANSAPLYLQGFGGDTSNLVIAAARAGAKTAYISRLGLDRFGENLMALWQAEGVDALAVTLDAAAPTGLYVITHNQTGHEFSYWRKGSAASLMAIVDLNSLACQERLRHSRYFHFSGISLAISATARETVFAAVQIAKDNGAQIAFDPNLRLRLWPLELAQLEIQRAISLCDIFLPGFDDLQSLTGLNDAEAMIDWSHQTGAKLVVLKLGSAGLVISDGKTQQAIAARRVTVVDAAGAGDCFCGNFLARLALGDDVITAAHYANDAASLAVQGVGAVAPLPTRAAVLSLPR